MNWFSNKIRIRAAVLVAIYLLRVVLVQSVISSPNASAVIKYKVTLAQHQSKNIPHVPLTHRLHFSKHSNSSIRLIVYNGDFGKGTIVNPDYSFKSSSLKLYIPPVFSSVSSNILKRYRFNCIWRI